MKKETVAILGADRDEIEQAISDPEQGIDPRESALVAVTPLNFGEIEAHRFDWAIIGFARIDTRAKRQLVDILTNKGVPFSYVHTRAALDYINDTENNA